MLSIRLYIFVVHKIKTMKQFRNIVTAFFTLFIFQSFAQGNLEEVIYMKDGSIYRGTIIETIPGQSYKIQIAGGSVFTLRQDNVMKITKEERRFTDELPAPSSREPQTYQDRMEKYRHRYHSDSLRIPHYKKKRSFFFLGEVRGGPGNGGIRVVNGFKAGRFGYFGIGVGIDGAVFNDEYLWGGMWSNNNSSISNGVYLPLYLRYAGDILSTRVTPFYYVEAGFAAHPRGGFFLFDDTESRSWGGPMGAIGIGCKFNTRRRINFNVNLNVNFRSNYLEERYYTYDQWGNYIYVSNRQWDRMLFGAVGFGIGF